jgi:hypothetical protein
MPTMEDKASQASGSNKPKPGLLTRVKKDYMKARTLVGSIRAAWKHARKPSPIALAKAHHARQSTLSSLAASHQHKVASGKISFTTRKK